MSLERKIIIEFNGTYWHCDQRFYKEDYYHDNKKLFAKEIWNKDKERIDAFQSMGFATFEIWENDFNKNKEKVLEELILGMTKNG